MTISEKDVTTIIISQFNFTLNLLEDKMKTLRNYFVFVMLTLAFTGIKTFAQTDYKFTESQIENLIAGIESDNDGVRKMAVYYAGLYNIKEVTKELLDQFKNEENAEIRKLIARVVYRNGELNDLEKLCKIALKFDDKIETKMCNLLYQDFKKNHETIKLVNGN